MFIEQPDESFRERMHQRHDAMTVRALMTIFDWEQRDAENAVAEMVSHFAGPLRDRLNHEGPINLAARIAGTQPTDLTQEPFIDKVRKYDDEVRPEFEKAAFDDYRNNVEPNFRRLKYGAPRTLDPSIA